MSVYPDILSDITDGPQVSLGGVQVALAVAPPVIRAGNPFQALLLAQNNTAAPVEFSAELNLPGRRKDHFHAQQPQMTLTLRPAETGYLMLPVATHPQTASGDYKLGVALSVRPQSKAEMLERSPVNLTQLSQQRATFEKLRKLTFSDSKRFGLRDEIEASFRVTSGDAEARVLPRAAWHSLWNLADHGTNSLLLRHYQPVLHDQVFRRLKPDRLYEPLLRATQARFEAAGYPLQPLEAMYIAKLLALVVHMAAPGEDQLDYLGSQDFNVAVLFKRDLPDEVTLPRWFEGLLRGIARDEKIAAEVGQYVAAQLYEPLLRDVLPFAFAMIQKITGEDMGTPEEIRDYTEKYIALLHNGGMDFAHAYLPLIMGGVVVYDRIILPGETLEDSLRDMGDVLDHRDAEWDEANDLIFLLTRELVNRSLRLFGFHI